MPKISPGRPGRMAGLIDHAEAGAGAINLPVPFPFGSLGTSVDNAQSASHVSARLRPPTGRVGLEQFLDDDQAHAYAPTPVAKPDVRAQPKPGVNLAGQGLKHDLAAR